MSDIPQADSFYSKVSMHLLHQAVVMYQSNLRAGTHKTKTRAEVVGSKKKMYKQKGTGRARAGNLRTPVRVGGGHAFAKSTRCWYYRLPRRSLAVATKMALRVKVEAGQLKVISDLKLADHKTKSLLTLLGQHSLKGEKCLLVIEAADPNLVLASRNLPNVTVMRRSDINCHEVLRHRFVVLDAASCSALVGS